MSQLDDDLGRWERAGLIDDATATRIRAFEQQRRPQTSHGQPLEAPGDERPGVLEVLIYLGVAVFAVGMVVLAGQNWSELQPEARIATIVVTALLTLAAGFGLRATGEPELVRGGNMTWLLTTALVAGAAAVIGSETDADDRTVVLMAGLAAILVALALWAIAASHPQVIGIGAALVLLAESFGNWPDDYSAALAGSFILVFGAAALALTELKLLRPTLSASTVFVLLTTAGPYHAGITGEVLWAELLTFAVAAAIIALGVWRARFLYLVVGVGLIFVNLITFIFEYFEEEVGVPTALMLSGAIVVAGVLILVQVRSMLRQRRQVPA